MSADAEVRLRAPHLHQSLVEEGGTDLVAKHLRPVILVAPNACATVRRHHIEMMP